MQIEVLKSKIHRATVTAADLNYIGSITIDEDLMDAAGITCAGDIIAKLDIPPEEVSILLINGFHQKPESPVKDGDVVALFPPVGGG